MVFLNKPSVFCYYFLYKRKNLRIEMEKFSNISCISPLLGYNIYVKICAFDKSKEIQRKEENQ